jgi:hypothetical protein
MPEPGDAITWQEAAHILDRSLSTAGRLVAAGELPKGPRSEHQQLSRLHVEQLSLARWDGVTSDDSYWVTMRQAAPVLGVNRSRVGQLVDAGRIPYETTPTGRRLFRRQQPEVIGMRDSHVD